MIQLSVGYDYRWPEGSRVSEESVGYYCRWPEGSHVSEESVGYYYRWPEGSHVTEESVHCLKSKTDLWDTDELFQSIERRITL